MAALFVSDVHLGAANPGATAPFIRFLQETAPMAGALYLLGDLFDAWLGDDDPAPPHEQVVAELAALARRGTCVSALHGNHDFLLGEAFERGAGCELLPDPSVIELDGQRLAIAHGDALCTDDADYQAWRAYTRERQNQSAFLALPLAARRERAASVRHHSQSVVRLKPEDIMDVNEQAVRELMDALDVDVLIHGHTHRPARHAVAGRAGAVRHVLGDWYGRSHVLVWDQGGCTAMDVERAHAHLQEARVEGTGGRRA